MSEFITNNQELNQFQSAAQPEEQQQPQQQDNVPVQSAPEDKNWKRMREENDRYKRESEDLKKQLESRMGDDELVEQRHLKAAIQKIQTENLDMRLKSKFPDFDSVVNTQALQKLAQEDPELAYTLDNTPDMYAKAVSAYKMIKAKEPRMPISEEESNLEENMYKPRSTNSLNPGAERPLAGANAFQRGLTAKQKSDLYAEMQEAIKNR